MCVIITILHYVVHHLWDNYCSHVHCVSAWPWHYICSLHFSVTTTVIIFKGHEAYIPLFDTLPPPLSYYTVVNGNDID